MIGLSPLSTIHPPSFQPWWVRSSTALYRSFNLIMLRSHGFGSTSCHLMPCSDSLSLRLHLSRLNLATKRNSLTHYAKGTLPSQLTPRTTTVCRHTVSGSLSLPSQGCFSPFPHGTCSLSVAEEYLALRGGPRRFQQGSTCPVVLGCLYNLLAISTCTGLLPALARLSSPVPVLIAISLGMLHCPTKDPTTHIKQRCNACTLYV